MKRLIIVLLAGAAFLASACGTSPQSSSSTAPRSQPTSSPHTSNQPTPGPTRAIPAATAAVEVWPIEPITLHGTVGHATDQPVLTAIRTGHHGTYDRLVLEFSTGFGDASVGYASVIKEDPSDQVLQLQGNAYLSVVIHGAEATWNAVLHKPYPGPFTVTPNYPTLKQVTVSGDFEAVLSFGIGLDRIAGFRASRLAGPDRLVIDVAQRPAWRLWPENSLAMARDTQSAFDHGHQPWRGNPVDVVRAYAAAIYRWNNASVTQVDTGAYRIHRNGESEIVHTTAPFSAIKPHSIILIAETR